MDGSTHIDTALRGYVDRIVHLHEQRDELNGDIREVYGELKDAGFVVGVVRGLVREYRMDADARNALYQQQEEYRIALGMLAGTPLGDAAIHTAEMPKPFAEQPVHGPKRRGRPRKTAADRVEEHLTNARRHLGGDEALWSSQADKTVGSA